jgi:hypothetical protein
MELARRAQDPEIRQQFWRCGEMWLEVATRIERSEQDWHKVPPKGPSPRATDAILCRRSYSSLARVRGTRFSRRQIETAYRALSGAGVLAHSDGQRDIGFPRRYS